MHDRELLKMAQWVWAKHYLKIRKSIVKSKKDFALKLLYNYYTRVFMLSIAPI